jgi:hypothetical protein
MEVSMKKIEVFDIEAEDIEEIAEAQDATVAEVVEALMEAIRRNEIDISDYL